MNCIEKIYNTQIEIKKSKFISYLVPYKEFKQKHQELKEKHPKANHIVYAYRYLNEHNQIVENSSDNGEPKGAAGVPTLNTLRGKDLVNCAILTVRYFGGIKLGVGGMVRAYSSSAKAVIESAKIVPYEPLIEYKLELSYSNQRQIEYNLKISQITDIKREFLEKKVIYILKATEQKINRLKELLV